MRQREDIDGLRGVAVLAVVGYHAGLPGFDGGLGGVDVFFVISGFLIAGIIVEAQQAGAFSLTGFWERRVRRIAPALLAMLTATTALAWLRLSPADLQAYARSMLAALISASNLWFWRQEDFFAQAEGGNLLLHTWSLGVEEQFYLLLPLVMLAGRRIAAGRLRALLALAALMSFLLCVWGAWRHPQATFYLPVTRAWELLAGVLLAMSPTHRPGPNTARIIGLVGLGLIGLAVLFIGRSTPLLGAAALVPCAGAILVIAAGPDSLSGRLLAIPPLRAVGLISYSLYLWHVPVLAAARLFGLDRGPGTTAAALALSFGLAWLSWRFIERPFREPARLSGRTAVIIAAAGATILALTAGVILSGQPAADRLASVQNVRASTTSS